MFSSIQAKIVGTVLLISLLSQTFNLLKTTGLVMTLISDVIFLLNAWLVTYDMDCLVNGGCNTWAWIRTAIIVISLVVWMIIMTFSTTLFANMKITAAPATEPYYSQEEEQAYEPQLESVQYQEPIYYYQ